MTVTHDTPNARREFAGMIAAAVAGAASLSVADKLTLSLVEASQLSGLSRGHLREAIEAKKLKARIIGRGWRVKRDDLDLYVKKL
jgi:excisionase family DNA binding protein